MCQKVCFKEQEKAYCGFTDSFILKHVNFIRGKIFSCGMFVLNTPETEN